jgi:hypothetical protein
VSASAQHVCSAHSEDNEAVWHDIAANASCCSRLCTTLIGPMLVLAASSRSSMVRGIFRCNCVNSLFELDVTI